MVAVRNPLALGASNGWPGESGFMRSLVFMRFARVLEHSWAKQLRASGILGLPRPPGVTPPQVFEQARMDNWELTAELQACATMPFMGIGATKLVEDAFQRQRRAEGASSNKKMSDLRMWSCMAEKKVLSSVHSFAEVDYQSEIPPRGFASKEPSSFHIPSSAGCAARSSIKGHQQRAEWYSPAPLTYFSNLGDMSLARQCNVDGDWQAAQKSWLSTLLNGDSICIRHRTKHNRFFLTFGSFAGLASQGWPLEARTAPNGLKLFAPVSVVGPGDAPYLHIFDLDLWEAFSFVWVGALRQEPVFGMQFEGLMVQPESEPIPLV